MKKLLYVIALLVATSACSTSESLVKRDDGTCVRKHSNRVLGVKLASDEYTTNQWGENYVCPGQSEPVREEVKGQVHHT